MERNLSPQFDLRPNMKDKANSQGTLFRVSTDARTPASRQPHGYSPQRREEVSRALMPRVYSHQPDAAQGLHQRAQLIFNLARSSAPTSAISSPKQWHLSGEYGDAEIQAGANGYYQPGPQAKIVLASGGERNEVALHELGHSVSYDDKTDHSRYDTPDRRGADEAYAENYAQEHTYSSGYKKRRTGPVERTEQTAAHRASAWAQSEATPEHSRAFTEAFVAGRNLTETPRGPQNFDTLFLAKNPQHNWVTQSQPTGSGSREDWTEPGNATVSHVGGQRVLTPIKIKPLPQHVLDAKKKLGQ